MVAELVDENKPLAYIIGTQPFYPLPRDLLVRPPTLIPRPETEHWLQHLAHKVAASINLGKPISRPFRLLDIGTGTGCIPLALAYSLRHSPRPVHALGVDQSPDAISLALENIQRCGSGIAGRVEVVQGDLFADDFASVVKRPAGLATPGGEEREEAGFDLVVSNPPYIPRADYEYLAASVREWEDRRALIGEVVAGDAQMQLDNSNQPDVNDDGLVFYRRIVSILPGLLSPDAGWGSGQEGARAPVVAFEVGAGQASAVRAMLEREGYRAEVEQDQWGIERLVLGYRV